MLERHHANNRRRRSPSPTYLDSVRQGPTGAPDSARPSSKKVCSARLLDQTDEDDEAGDKPKRRHGKYSKNPKGFKPAKPTSIGFYPPLWTKLLNHCKSSMRLALIMNTPFPRIETAVEKECAEVLFEGIAYWEDRKFDVEAGKVHLRDLRIQLTRFVLKTIIRNTRGICRTW